MTTKPNELVNHPSHYNEHPAGIECIDVVEDFSFNLGNAIKYIWRAGLKAYTDVDTDLQKALWYIERERDRLVFLERQQLKRALKNGKA
jgi:hypothetical protein